MSTFLSDLNKNSYICGLNWRKRKNDYKNIAMKNLNTIINFVNQNPSFIINLIDRDDGKNKKQGLETIPTRACV